jgi:serine/threonine protein kinase
VPPTERIAPLSATDSPTVRVAPAESPNFEEPHDDKLFDQYTIYSKIGSGGMGVVYLGRDRRLGRFVAIKRLNHQAQSIPSLRQRFLHEARAVAALSHVHIVHIYSLGEDDDGPFIVMEYIAGPDESNVKGEPQEVGGLVQPNPPLTLDQYVARHGQLTAEEATELLIKIGRAVAYAHASGVIHRDLKPSNILLDKSGEPKIVDFGLARLMHKEDAKLTVPGEKLLSLGYGAPEQESDASLSDERADVYGLGALLYFALTGQNPRYFREQDVPVPLRDVVVKALATDKEQRWPSASVFTETLHQIQSKTRVETPTVKTTWRCKWCDAVNPLTLKFCAECGWDGTEVCAECGAETFVGMQFCGNCGADARAYEALLSILKKMREAASQQRFERVISYAGRVHGFEPAGPSGRRFLTEITTLREQAEKNIRHREQLKNQIPIEIRAENFERAALFIQQYLELAEDKRSFESEAKQIPEWKLKRDLQRAHRALKNREWDSARRICDELLHEVPADNPHVMDVKRAIRMHAVFSDVWLCCGVFASVVLLYLMSLPLAAKSVRHPFGTAANLFYRPGLWVYVESPVAPVFQRYAKLWLGDDDLGDRFRPEEVLETEGMVHVVKPDALDQKQREYARQMTDIESEQSVFQDAWPAEYSHELDLMMEKRRTAGDFEGWAVVQAERKRFDETRQIGDLTGDEQLSELNVLKNKYRQMLSDQRLLHSRKLVTICKKYVNDLTDMQKTYMREGKMDLASAVNTEIRRVKGAPQQQAAEAVLATATTSGAVESETPPQILLSGSGEGRVREIAKMRGDFERELAEVERVSSAKVSAWPDKYMAELTELTEQFQRAGDYGGWESVRDEIGRFEADRAILQRNIVLQPVKLTELQRRYYLQLEDIKRGRAEGIVNTTEKYVKKLQALQKKLTVEGQMDTAAIVNAEIKRVRSRVDFIEAQNEISPQGPPVPPSVFPAAPTSTVGVATQS